MQMLAQSQADRDAEKAVIDGFNTKLTAKVAAFQSSHAGVSLDSFVLHTTSNAHVSEFRQKHGYTTQTPNWSPFLTRHHPTASKMLPLYVWYYGTLHRAQC